jgi:hypothetical protein
MHNQSISPTIYIIWGGISVVQFFAAIGVWRWKRKALFFIYGTAVCSTAVNIYIGLPTKNLLFGLVGVGIFYLLTKNKVKDFT